MSNTVWPFTLLRPYTERPVHLTTRQELNNGRQLRRAEFGTYGLMRIEGRCRVPYGGYTATDLYAFILARQGGYDPFLIKCQLARHKTQTLEAVGTGNGSATAFPLDMKHVDASTLLVYKDAVLQTLTTHYTLGTNNTAPTINFVAAPGNGLAITATYDYYHPVVFEDDDLSPLIHHLTGSDATTIAEIPVRLRETEPGAHVV